MADPLSVAAAGAGFLSLAGQVLDGIVKLRGFIATVNSAPREIHDLCHELDIFRGLLEEAGRRVQESLSMGVDSSQLKDAFAHCEKMRGYAESALKRLEVNIHRSKSTTALRFPFRKKEIEGMLLGVERGKTSLLLANQSFESYVPPSRTVASRRLIVTNEYRSLASRRHALLSDLQNEKFASIAHDVAASTQVSTAQIRGLQGAYTEGWYVARDSSFEKTLLIVRQPPDTYYAFAITKAVHIDFIQRHWSSWSSSANSTHCHKRLQCRACHQRSQRTPRGADIADRIANTGRDDDSHDFIIPLDAS